MQRQLQRFYFIFFTNKVTFTISRHKDLISFDGHYSTNHNRAKDILALENMAQRIKD